MLNPCKIIFSWWFLSLIIPSDKSERDKCPRRWWYAEWRIMTTLTKRSRLSRAHIFVTRCGPGFFGWSSGHFIGQHSAPIRVAAEIGKVAGKCYQQQNDRDSSGKVVGEEATRNKWSSGRLQKPAAHGSGLRNPAAGHLGASSTADSKASAQPKRCLASTAIIAGAATKCRVRHCLRHGTRLLPRWGLSSPHTIAHSFRSNSSSIADDAAADGLDE